MNNKEFDEEKKKQAEEDKKHLESIMPEIKEKIDVICREYKVDIRCEVGLKPRIPIQNKPLANPYKA